MDTGFVLSDKTRHLVLTAVAGGEGDLAQVAKRHHLVSRAVERAATELEGAGLVAKKGDVYAMTPLGENVLKDIKRTGKQ
ncbi:MAG: hypothetical protein ACYDDF_06520 [Thermoplasmatota archaeon]